jgi:ABC-type lipoprotein release transport system permease subunit
MESWIERQRNILDFTISSLLRRKGKNIALVAAYTLVVFILSSIIFLTYSLKREAQIILKETPEIIVQRSMAGRHELVPTAYLEEIRKIPGVSAVQSRLWGYYYDRQVGANYTVIAPEGFTLGPGNIIIGEGVARTRLLSRGDQLEFKAFDGLLFALTIRSMISAESELVTSDLVLMPEQDFRRLFGTPSRYATDLVVQVRNAKEVSTVAMKIGRILPDTRVILREEILQTYETVFSWRGGLLLVIFGGAFLAFVIFACDKASGLSEEERKEIGILKAIGWETSDILLMKFWEGQIISLSSFLVGVLLGYVHVFFASSTLFAPVLKGWATLYPQFRLIPFIDSAQIAALLFMTVIPYTVATIIPSWRAATLDPDSVMRI